MPFSKSATEIGHGLRIEVVTHLAVVTRRNVILATRYPG